MFTFSSLAISLLALSAPPTSYGLRVPPGFEVTEWADGTLANDIHCLTVDPAGRVVVSGRGYLRLLLDETGAGRATRAIDFAGAPRDGAQGLFWEKSDLYCMGDGGLHRYRDANGAGRNRPPELLHRFKTGGEHTAHAIRRGPDGWFYVLVGDHAGVTAKEASLPTSPIKEPVGGCVVRFAPDFRGSEIVADGFRNPYGFDFNSRGDLFTFDSDNERCVSLPWYQPTSCYHVAVGGRHGWQGPQRAAVWRMPSYFLDVVPPIATLGRGSPTGVVCYRHVQFPQRYRDGLFLLDWTFGKVHFLPLTPTGTSYSTRPEVFLESTGDNGFAPTAAAVDPRTGDLYLSIGGRGTRGAVYRIRFPQGAQSIRADAVARLQPSSHSLAWRPDRQAERLRSAMTADLPQRLQALLAIERHREHFDAAQVGQVVRANWETTDRLFRQATARLAATLPGEQRLQLGKEASSPRSRITLGLADSGAQLADLIADRTLPAGLRLDAVRLVQLHLGDLSAVRTHGMVWDGYSRRQTVTRLDDATLRALGDSFPSGNTDLDRELARILGLVEDDDPAMLQKVIDRLTATSHPTDDVHYLIVLARLRGTRTKDMTTRTADALVRLDAKAAERKLNRERNWLSRLAETHAELARKDPALNAALLAHADFGRPDHALWAECPGFDKVRAAERFLARSERDPDFAWNASLIGLLASLPEDRALPVLRRLWGQQGQDEAILPLLARRPHAEDRQRFLDGLNSAQLTIVRQCVDALAALPPRRDRDETLRLVLALRRLPAGKDGDPVRGPLTALLKKTTGEDLADADAWAAWLLRQHPDLAGRLRDSDGVDVAAWSKRLTAIDWAAGDAGRGRQVYLRANCAACHSGALSIGPDLAGVAGRFSRADLFTAILQPSKDVATRYRTTLLTTSAGKSYQGIIIYEANDSMILHTGSATTVRLAHVQISERRLTTQSLMPAGLLDRLTDGEIADLYAHLRSLK